LEDENLKSRRQKMRKLGLLVVALAAVGVVCCAFSQPADAFFGKLFGGKSCGPAYGACAPAPCYYTYCCPAPVVPACGVYKMKKGVKKAKKTTK
jgi:hypothetical protein